MLLWLREIGAIPLVSVLSELCRFVEQEVTVLGHTSLNCRSIFILDKYQAAVEACSSMEACVRQLDEFKINVNFGHKILNFSMFHLYVFRLKYVFSLHM